MFDSKKYKILYIEDDAETAEFCRVVLDSHGYDVTLAETGMLGLDFFEQHDFDAVILDYKLPDISGLEVAEKILEQSPITSVIFMTGRGSEKIAAEAVAIGVTYYVIKDTPEVYSTILPELIQKAIVRTKDRREILEINEQLRISEERYRSIFEGTAEGVITIDAEGLIEALNPQAEKIIWLFCRRAAWPKCFDADGE